MKAEQMKRFDSNKLGDIMGCGVLTFGSCSAAHYIYNKIHRLSWLLLIYEPGLSAVKTDGLFGRECCMFSEIIKFFYKMIEKENTVTDSKVMR